MKTIFSVFPKTLSGKILLPILLGLFTLPSSADVAACGPVFGPLHCPVAGLGGEFQKDCCPGGYCGRKVSLKSPSLDYKGGKIYFCCGGCLEQFKKSPTAFAANANHQLVASLQAKQVACPISGGDLKNPVMVLVGEIPVLLNNADCKKTFDEAKSAQRLQMIFADAAFAKAFVVKTKAAAPAATTAPVQKTQTSGTSASRSARTVVEGCCCGKQE